MNLTRLVPLVCLSLLAPLGALADHAPNDMLLSDLPAGSALVLRNAVDLGTQRLMTCTEGPGTAILCTNRVVFLEGKGREVIGRIGRGFNHACVVRDTLGGTELPHSLTPGVYPITRASIHGNFLQTTEVALSADQSAGLFQISCVNHFGNPSVGSLRRALGFANIMIRLPEGVAGYETAERAEQEAAKETYQLWEDARSVPWF